MKMCMILQNTSRRVSTARDAAAKIRKDVELPVKSCRRSTYCASMYHLKTRGATVHIHCDDFVVSAAEEIAIRSLGQLRGRFGVTVSFIGNPKSTESFDIKTEGILNRVVRWTEQGFEYEADMKHVDIKVAGLGLQGARESRRWRKEPLMGSGKVPRIFSQSLFLGVRSHGHPTLCENCAEEVSQPTKRRLEETQTG